MTKSFGITDTFMDVITEPMMLLLLAVGVMYSIWGKAWDAATIIVTILVVVGLEVSTEWRASNALLSLSNSVPANTSVLREGREGVVAADELVPGDVILLAHGQSVPADAVVAVSYGLAVDESMLTGESISVYKAALDDITGEQAHRDDVGDDDTIIEIPRTLVCAGTTVTGGRAVCVVVATGRNTEIASNVVQLMRGSKPPPTPLQRRMKKLAGTLSIAAISVCIVIPVIGLLQGMSWHSAVLMGMSLAFATIPEELPLIAKASLALGARQLAKHNLLVRKLSAADALSEVSVIVTDKTGTLTRNQLVVSSVLAIGENDAGAPAIEIITPEAFAVSERSSALVTPLYSAWSLSVDPLEAKPLAHFLVSARSQMQERTTVSPLATHRSPPRDAPGSFKQLRGFGKDFMNSAVLQSLVGESDVLPRDPDTKQMPLMTVVNSISSFCETLPVPTGELPFDPTLRISARTRSVAQKLPGNSTSTSASVTPKRELHWTVVKGAPDILLPLCNRVWKSTGAPNHDIAGGTIDGVQPLSDSFAQAISRSAINLAAGGSRIIGYAIAITEEPLFSHAHNAEAQDSRRQQQQHQQHQGRRQSRTEAQRAFQFREAVSVPSGKTAGLQNLIFVGAFAFYDPPQREARPVIQECQSSGIRVIIATGDHPSTALAVSTAVGISEVHSQPPADQCIRRESSASYGTFNELHAVTGEMIQKSLTNGTFDKLIDESNVFARVTPAQKLRLARGETVAFIGDGINDAPSLTRADVGICMGGNPSTADVAMDAASLIVLSGRFSGVVRCLREGRRLSANIEKCMVFYVSCKLAIVLLFVFLLVAEGASPLTPIQVILIELFTDLGATWTFLTERAEGVPHNLSDDEASLNSLKLVADTLSDNDGSAGDRRRMGFLGSKSTDWAVLIFGSSLFVTCLVPLIVPSILLPSWAVAPVAPTISFLTWLLAHSLLGTSLRTRLVPLRVHDGVVPRVRGKRANRPGTAWLVLSIWAVVVAATVPPISSHLGVVKLDAIEWALVVVAPVLLFVALECAKEIRFATVRRDHGIGGEVRLLDT
ncbi:hypothetical protein FBU59_000167 [Linderina macrospora]|uniref:Uncharacterized protein n=1 Tax=Linderina macrospora TaxID=4868 RepID=A0ACC1JHD9_9FUNG|nr:hypothetical protein FBU59_000167 [Linderina macrospora]